VSFQIPVEEYARHGFERVEGTDYELQQDDDGKWWYA